MNKKRFVDLQTWMRTVPAGEINNTLALEELLSDCWGELRGDTGGMAGYKLKNRLEDAKWDPPILSFAIERHGGIVMGSGYAEIQDWKVNLDDGTATLERPYSPRKRWVVGHRNSPLKVGPIAAEIGELIVKGKQDPRLKWKSPNEAKVVIGVVVPDNCPQQTLTGRRKRFKKALQEYLNPYGWELFAYANVVQRITPMSGENPSESSQASVRSSSKRKVA